jgi:predicted enzyme related to lactoylglutathione lyase
VKSIDDFLARIEANGGSVVMPRHEIAPRKTKKAKKKR